MPIFFISRNIAIDDATFNMAEVARQNIIYHCVNLISSVKAIVFVTRNITHNLENAEINLNENNLSTHVMIITLLFCQNMEILT